MSEPVRVPPGIDALIRSVVGGAGEAERDERASTFARGLALGALVGAAIAGSTIWQRRQARLHPPAGDDATAEAAAGTNEGATPPG
ncbi:MAG TPA: hypothetical protein VFP22_10835 [Candidatus Limnocylindrales bacterium]|nr:hypothetical protein [Candidatus Limnocylindrales bacterium]